MNHHSERRPKDGRWLRIGIPPSIAAKTPSATSAWQLGHVCVVSSLAIAEMPDGNGSGPQWHVSISDRGARPKDKHVRRAKRAFGMVGAEEDNHHPGAARHFWLTIDPARRVDCECKEGETTVTDPDGYSWQNDPNECRGCEYRDLMGSPCPVHGIEVANPSRAPLESNRDETDP